MIYDKSYTSGHAFVYPLNLSDNKDMQDCQKSAVWIIYGIGWIFNVVIVHTHISFMISIFMFSCISTITYVNVSLF